MNMSCTRVLTLPARSATQKLFSLNAVTFSSFHRKLKRSFVSSRAASEGVYEWLGQFQSNQYTAGSSYFKEIIQHTELARSFSSSSAGSSKSIEALPLNSTGSSNHLEEATTVAIGNHISSVTQAAANAALCQQHVKLPSSFAVPLHTSVPAYQLVGVFRSMLGWPNLPQAAKATTVEAKWGMLQLLLMQAEGDEQGFAQQLHQLLDEVLLPDALGKLKKVQANPKIPEPNKRSAEERYHSLYANCQHTITRWAAATIGTPAFQQLWPAMVAVSKPVKVSLASGNWHCPALSASSGKLMEQTALAVLQASLPANWSLLPSLHLLGADGQVFAVQQGCKYEADMLVLDDQGVAVAIVEVKLAAANPLMSLFNDVNSLLRLVEHIKGKTVTAITRSDLSSILAAEILQQEPATAPTVARPVIAASAAAIEEPEQSDFDCSSPRNNSGSSRGKIRPAAPVLAKARAATQQAPFAQGPAWQTVHIKVHPSVVPIYVLGKSIGEAEVLKGLASLVDSAALKLLSTSAADVAQAIVQPMQATQDQQQQALQKPLQEASSNVEGSLLRSNSGGSTGCAGSGSSSRITLGLSHDQQQKIKQQVQRRMAVLEQCMIYSVCAR